MKSPSGSRYLKIIPGHLGRLEQIIGSETKPLQDEETDIILDAFEHLEKKLLWLPT